MYDFLPLVREPIAESEAMLLNPLVLAFVGDGVQTLFERTLAAFTLKTKPHELHVAVADTVNAKAQAAAFRSIESTLTETENAVFHRARNSKTQTSAKNATISDYRVASGYEAIMGFLYLTGNSKRLDYLLNAAYGRIPAEELPIETSGAGLSSEHGAEPSNAPSGTKVSIEGDGTELSDEHGAEPSNAQSVTEASKEQNRTEASDDRKSAKPAIDRKGAELSSGKISSEAPIQRSDAEKYFDLEKIAAAKFR